MRTVMNDDVHLFAALSGDTNPIHISEAFAASTKFGQRIAHGMFTASLVSAILGTRLPGPGPSIFRRRSSSSRPCASAMS